MTRFALALLPALFACDSAPVEAPPAEPTAVETSAGDGLHRTLALARACVGGAPHNGLGMDGSPLLLDHFMSIRDAGEGVWEVSYTEAAPLTEDYGRSVHIDPEAGTCEGTPISAPATEPGPSMAGLFEAAFACASSRSDGEGVGGSALVREDLSISVSEGGSLVASVPEAETRTRPSGMDVHLGRDGSECAQAAMD